MLYAAGVAFGALVALPRVPIGLHCKRIVKHVDLVRTRQMEHVKKRLELAWCATEHNLKQSQAAADADPALLKWWISGDPFQLLPKTPPSLGAPPRLTFTRPTVGLVQPNPVRDVLSLLVVFDGLIIVGMWDFGDTMAFALPAYTTWLSLTGWAAMQVSINGMTEVEAALLTRILPESSKWKFLENGSIVKRSTAWIMAKPCPDFTYTTT